MNYEITDTVKHNELHCRVCTVKIDASTGLTGAAVPETGAYSICWNCGEVSVYVVGPFGVALREPTMDELAAFAGQNPGLVLAILAIASKRRDRQQS